MTDENVIHLEDIPLHPERGFVKKTFMVVVDEMKQEVHCEGDEYIHIARRNIGLISVLLNEDTAQAYELLPLIFEGDHRNACRQRQLSKSGILIWDNNDRSGTDPEAIKFSIILRKKETNEYLYMDPIVIND